MCHPVVCVSFALLCVFVQAEEFRQLWGSRSELRRFQDGDITEAVVWEGETTCQKRLVPRQLITHLLQLYVPHHS